jgi:hypothetical protein
MGPSLLPSLLMFGAIIGCAKEGTKLARLPMQTIGCWGVGR